MTMKANALIKHNIITLLKARGQKRQDLAQWCRRSGPWLTQILNRPNRELPMKYFDRVADFFGIATYQLLQPGISHLTERRQAERRLARDRRVSKALQFDVVPSPHPTPDEWALIAVRRKLTGEEQAQLDHAADVLRLTSGAGAKTAPPGTRLVKGQRPKKPSPGARSPKRASGTDGDERD